MEVEMNGKSITIGVIMLLAVALSPVGINELLEPEQYENAYYCDVTDEIGVFLGGISETTGLSGYPHADNRKDVAYCKNEAGFKGQWEDLVDYAESQGIDPLSLIVKPQVIPVPEPIVIPIEVPDVPGDVPNPGKGPSYCCGQNGCKIKVGSCNG